MSTAAMTHRLELPSLADAALKAAARFWFVVTVIGQLVFALAVASFYGLTALRGDFHSWSRFLTRGWVRGDGLGNLAVAMHVGSAVAVMLAGTVKGPVGLDPQTFTDPFPTFMSFAQYLIPLGVLEIYLRAEDRPGAIRRMPASAMLFILTLAMGAGIFAATMAIWVQQVKAGFDPRKSIAETLSPSIASGGIDQAVQQYQDLKAAAPATYHFDENELNYFGLRTDPREQAEGGHPYFPTQCRSLSAIEQRLRQPGRGLP